MALPPSLDDLLTPSGLPDAWRYKFAPYAWCRISGLNQLNKFKVCYRGDDKSASNLFHKDGMKRLLSKQLRRAAVARIPPAWVEQFPQLAWDTPIGQAAMRNVVNGAIDPIPLDRACLALSTVDALLDEFGYGAEPIHVHVRVAPAIFILQGFNDSYFKATLKGPVNAERYRSIKKLTNNFADEFYEDLSAGHPATHETLTTLAKALVQDGEFFGEVRGLHGPMDRDSKPARFEMPVFPST